jgi:hypothetical protein
MPAAVAIGRSPRRRGPYPLALDGSVAGRKASIATVLALADVKREVRGGKTAVTADVATRGGESECALARGSASR